eukprot:TRINITY_DN8098_c0_g1_i2.p2 TRINITY_DN8098_c0_g1~~TRINITY_DN8098_c0_g1_i2.p2  ORF type:complete len:105 (+),score=23.59 TRINITY_DN8098_c0_g1_i2:334-648(+)
MLMELNYISMKNPLKLKQSTSFITKKTNPANQKNKIEVNNNSLKNKISTNKFKAIIHYPKFAERVSNDGIKKIQEEEKKEETTGTNYWWYIGILAIPVILLSLS